MDRGPLAASAPGADAASVGGADAASAGPDGPAVRVVVLMGGFSPERPVSLASGAQVARALRTVGHTVHALDPARGPLEAAEEERLLERGVESPAAPDEPPAARLPSGEEHAGVAADPVSPAGARHGGGAGRGALAFLGEPLLRKAEAVFLALHGGAGEDGTVQAALDLLEIPYTGSGHLGCALAMDKEVSKRLFRDGGVMTPSWTTASPPGRAVAAEEVPAWPVVVKPASGGSTLGLTVVDEPPALEGAIRRAGAYGERVLLEAHVAGREITVGVLGEETLPVGEIVPEHAIFDYECKYRPGMAREIFPADLPVTTARAAREAALRVHRLLRLEGLSRVDFILDGEGVPWCLEANALPGLTGNSLLPRAAAAAGIGFPDLCDRILRSARLHGSGAGASRSP